MVYDILEGKVLSKKSLNNKYLSKKPCRTCKQPTTGTYCRECFSSKKRGSVTKARNKIKKRKVKVAKGIYEEGVI